jgi:hypothetical protein
MFLVEDIRDHVDIVFEFLKEGFDVVNIDDGVFDFELCGIGAELLVVVFEGGEHMLGELVFFEEFVIGLGLVEGEVGEL